MLGTSTQNVSPSILERSRLILENSDRYASDFSKWLPKKKYFQSEDLRYLRFLIPEGSKVLDLGCGIGDKIAGLKPVYGLGVDFSRKSIEVAKNRHSNTSIDFITADIEDKQFLASLDKDFDFILLSDVIGLLNDCQNFLSNVKSLCSNDTRVIISYYNHAWSPIIKFSELVGLKMRQIENNYLSTKDTFNLLNLAGLRPIKREWRQLIPQSWFGIGHFINQYIGTLPIIRHLCLRNYIIARIEPKQPEKKTSSSVIITTRNEKGNIEAAIKRLPKFCDDMEIIFAEGGSNDGTLDEIHRVIKAYPHTNISVVVQDGKGKGDAVRKGFAAARKDILFILDGDLTTPPEDMPKFYNAITSGKGEFINGTRLIYPMEDQAMQFLNLIANKLFSLIFTYLLNQRLTDTLCGTKVLLRKHYEKIAENRNYFGEFDPFGDFDLIFGASKLNLEVAEIPVRYSARTYGQTQISRFQHGWLLIKMVIFAYRKLKIFK